MIDYQKEKYAKKTITVNKKSLSVKQKHIHLGVIGAGQFAQGILLPEIKKIRNVRIETISTSSGFTSLNVAKKYKAARCTSNNNEVFTSSDIDAVLIATRHDSHSSLVVQSMKSGKHCFVEKPIALNEKQLKLISSAYKNSNSILMVGYNRRFSPFVQTLKNEIGRGSLVLNYRINAGSEKIIGHKILKRERVG